MRALISAALPLLLAACASAQAPKSNAPAPTVLEVRERVYVPIPPEATKRCAWPRKGKPSEAMDVANKRKTCLAQYEIQLDGIEKIQGKPAPAMSAGSEP